MNGEGAEVHRPAETRRRGSYTANLLGNIRGHLAGLQGYDVMALELIQNADDAGAEEVAFDITGEGLAVRNSGEFTYCGDLDSSPCSRRARFGYDCDYHRIVDVGSGGKLLQSENIGRFGIGFLSTYQVCDHPEIRSAGIRLTLIPESGEWTVEEPYDESGGTTLFLPWARDPASATRLALRVSHVGSAHIARIVDDITRVLRQSLLFLRHVRRAEVRRDGALVLGCELDRADGSDLKTSFRPGGEVERWKILRADAADAARSLCAEHPQLASLGRSTEVGVGLRVEPGLLSEGRLYAFLPTEQPTGLPLHINGDFFPESDRKHVIFAGHQHEQAWNEMLVEAAAEEIARDPEGLFEMLGYAQLWELLGRAYELDGKGSGHPECYRRIWELIKGAAALARIVPTQDGSVQRPDGVYLPPNALTADQAGVLLEVGGRAAVEELRPFWNAMVQLGAHRLTLEPFVGLLERAMSGNAGKAPVDDERVAGFFRPLWRILEELIPAPEKSGAGTREAVERLKGLPVVVTQHGLAVPIDESYAVPAGLDHGRVAALLPGLGVVSRRFAGYPNLGRLVRVLNLDVVAAHIRFRLDSASAEEVVGGDRTALRGFYGLLVDLDDRGGSADGVYEVLRGLPIWPSSRGLVPAKGALLPGDFRDPIGRSELLDIALLPARVCGFLTGKIGVTTQTIEAYVRNVLPGYFGDAGPADPSKYGRLMTELADHPSLANDETTRKLLGSLRLVPTRDGGWSRPGDSYRRSEGLVKVLGEARQLWLDESRIPDVPTVHGFLDLVGIRQTAAARHLVERIVCIADGFAPGDDARAASREAFYALCDEYEARKEDDAFQEAIAELRGADCLPADGDPDTWYPPDSLYAPFRADAFRSQAHILDFRSTTRLKTELLEAVGVTIEPSTRLVVDHLKHCMEHGVAPHRSTYRVLNERAESDPLVSELEGTRCIYVGDGFVRTNQVYWVAQQLGRYAFTVPESIKSFTPLFGAIGVKDAPECSDYVEILLDLVGEHYEGSAAVAGAERTVYDTCLAAIAAAHEREECGDADLRRLAEAPTILNLAGMATLPDEILLHDSEWYAGFFGGELDQALCRLPAEHWALAEALGVRRLSQSARVSLDYVGEPQREEAELAERFAERKDIFARLLHDQPARVQEGVRVALGMIEAVSGEDLRIEASVDLGGGTTFAPPSAAHAFYDGANGCLTVRRPVDRRRWAHILNAVFHQLMPDAPGGEISTLTLGVRPLMEMGVEEAHRELTDAGVPDLDSGPESTEPGDLASPELGGLGAGEDATGDEETDEAGLESASEPPDGDLQDGVRKVRDWDLRTLYGDDDGAVEGEDPRGERDAAAEEGGEAGGRPEAEVEDRGDAQSDGHAQGAGTDGTPPRKKPRPKHKQQWDRRLLSYVRRKAAEPPEDGDDAVDPLEHNLAVEAAARAAVCSYEEERGRLPEQMAQTHPGYDIVSRDPRRGEDRRIEVKGVAGEWNQTGVGLSGLQFSNAQNYGEAYWLYVVEFVEDPEHTRIHAIQNPAMRVTAFMFDGNWREAAVDERADPTMRFVPGVRVRHESHGTGEIRKVVERGISKSLTIWFDRTQQEVPNVALNLAVIRVLEEDDGDDDT